MHRESLVHHEGMLFMFDETKVRHFWMRDVLLPLDMIWIDSDRRVQ